MAGIPSYTRVQRAYYITSVLYALLLAAIAIEHFALRQISQWPVWLIQTIPLLLVLPGWWRRQTRSGIWLDFLLLFYFLLFVGLAAGAHHRIAHVLMALLVVAAFISAMLFVRWQAQRERAMSQLSCEEANNSLMETQ